MLSTIISSSIARRVSRGVSTIQVALQLSNLALYIGAGLSLSDLVCDILMVNEFTRKDQERFATATLVTIGLSMSFQMIIVFISYSNQSWYTLLWELLFVITLVKPGVDCYWVIQHQKQKANAALDPLTEMVYIKEVELITDCIPGAVIQAIAFVNGQHSYIAVVSLMSNVPTAAFIAASMALEKDIGVLCREHSPDFYGIVDLSSKRGTALICLQVLIMNVCQLAAKAFACALCFVESPWILIIYLGVDMTLLIAFKLARRDFLYWIKVKSKPLHFFASLLARVGIKIMLDFTGSLLLRHPYEFGGAYYSFTLITTPLLCFYFGSRYLAYVDDEEVSSSLDFVFMSEQVNGAIGSLVALQTICYISFLAIIEPKYRKTFLGTTTASQMTMAKFQETRDDHVKLEFTFDVHPSLWAPIKDEVKNWVNEALRLWIREQPDWFDDHAKASIPDNFVTD
ncbi:hypothetical protein TrLO_g6094 [Triparma laevis f. longispina]|uniref:Uncharacterized protein n=1 Tax=Triparma laevis f. longispina TaxID=1714387 RepID=A0A9W7CFC6_9STRA|nr:hypothetical protein TrLO_g6094 [Triparma laevis f. longispina]